MFIKLVVNIAVVYTVDRLEEILSQEIITNSKAGKIWNPIPYLPTTF